MEILKIMMRQIYLLVQVVDLLVPVPLFPGCFPPLRITQSKHLFLQQLISPFLFRCFPPHVGNQRQRAALSALDRPSSLPPMGPSSAPVLGFPYELTC
jgi:hypothetical protein